ncbi:hypothetical protein EBS80_01665 [bacterium]|nr:hypothetical protein [bacterium]
MKRLLVLLAAVPLIFPLAALADEPAVVHGVAVYDASASTTYAPSNALGAPDGVYAEFNEDLSFVTLDLGDELAEGDLTMTYRMTEFGAYYQVDFLDTNGIQLERANGSFPLYQTEIAIPYAGSEPYRYAKISCPTTPHWQLDAVSATQNVVEVTAPIEIVPEEETPSSQGLLVKLVDDGDTNTTVDAAVYEIGADGNRHAFPSLAVYETWYHDFEDIAFIDADHLAEYQLGGNVTVRPGTKLVKIQSDPKVYAVGPDATLHWVTTEELAQGLYGNDWNTRVLDVPAGLWGNYAVGDPITTELHPDGAVGVREDGSVVYLGNDTIYTLGAGATRSLRIDDYDYVRVTDADLAARPGTAELTDDPDVAFPY